jgi:uncharacterized protein YecE (DUF72 family)
VGAEDRDLNSQTDKTFVFMNNCFKGKAATNALQMKELVESSELMVQS